MWFYLIVSRAAGRKDRISLQKWGTHQSRVERASLIAQLVKNPPAMQETPVQFLGQEDPLEKGKATHSSILGLPLWLSCWRICVQCGRPGFNPWVGKIPWRRKWQPTPVLLLGKFHQQRSMVGYSPWGRKESDMNEWLHFVSSLRSLGHGAWIVRLPWGIVLNIMNLRLIDKTQSPKD